MISKTLSAALAIIASPLSAPPPARAGQQKSSASDQSPRVIKLWPSGFQQSFKKISTVDQDANLEARLFSAMRGTALAAASYASANLN
jgi:hypothetical protein